MRLLLLCALVCTSAVYAHTPVCRCQLNGEQIDCEAGYHDGSDAAGESMRLMSYSGEVLAEGELDEQSRFSVAMPKQAFYLLLDIGPGEVFEVDWRDVIGIAADSFPASTPDDLTAKAEATNTTDNEE